MNSEALLVSMSVKFVCVSQSVRLQLVEEKKILVSFCYLFILFIYLFIYPGASNLAELV